MSTTVKLTLYFSIQISGYPQLRDIFTAHIPLGFKVDENNLDDLTQAYEAEKSYLDQQEEAHCSYIKEQYRLFLSPEQNQQISTRIQAGEFLEIDIDIQVRTIEFQ